MNALKFVFVGAESTGTTTVSRLVAERLEAEGYLAEWIPEYGRDYTWDKLRKAQEVNPSAGMDDLVWAHEDFSKIAKCQNALEKEAAARGRVAICDTDSWATTLWERRYLGATSLGTLGESTNAAPSIYYFVTDHDGVPFSQDGIRDGELIRPEMTEWFTSALKEGSVSYLLLSGSLDERVESALKTIRGYL